MNKIQNHPNRLVNAPKTSGRWVARHEDIIYYLSLVKAAKLFQLSTIYY
ncbi:hypothetical protein N9I68_03655 [Bacteroidia bacterium]|nr:hypothetical protein [Bacteroidia bacterium]